MQWELIIIPTHDNGHNVPIIVTTPYYYHDVQYDCRVRMQYCSRNGYNRHIAYQYQTSINGYLDQYSDTDRFILEQDIVCISHTIFTNHVLLYYQSIYQSTGQDNHRYWFVKQCGDYIQ